MNLVPRTLLKVDSRAEIEIFKLIKNVQLGAGWSCLHSLNLSDNHRFKAWSEIDFLLIGPKGIFVLEVKGGGVSCDNGIWSGTDRRGRVHQKKESPFDQARDARYALEKSLFKLGPEIKWHREFCFGWGVVFPDIDDFSVPGVELPLDVVADRKDCQTVKGFTKYLEKLFAYWNNKAENGRDSNVRLAEQCVKVLRPNFDLTPTLSATSKRLQNDLVSFTDEQYEKLDGIEGADRIICTGGAGTGKTFLAMATARRSAADGDRVLFCVPGEILASFLKSQDQEENITICSFDALKDLAVGREWDVLVVDEGQDLLSLEAISMLDNCIVGGVEKGRWRWFMDHNNQAGLVSSIDAEAINLLNDWRQVPLKLKRNCRNTPQIVMQTQLATGAELGEAESKGFGMVPEFHAVSSDDSFSAAVEQKVKSWLDGGVEPSGIAILTAKNIDSSYLSEFSASFRSKVVLLDEGNVGACDSIILSTIKDFKGLERSFVAITDLDDLEMVELFTPALYVGMTRANLGLWLAMSNEFKSELDGAIAKHALILAQDGGG